MDDETMSARVGDTGHYRYVGRGRLLGHRLSFTTRTPEWNDEPVSDLTQDDRYAVYGVVYDVDTSTLDSLTPHEPTYERVAVTLNLYDEGADINDASKPDTPAQQITATAFQVAKHKKQPEGVPHDPYLTRILEAATSRRLPTRYIESLRSLRKADTGTARFVICPTKNRGSKKPLPMLQLPPSAKAELDIKDHALVSYRQRCCLAEVQARPDLAGRMCGLDENLRIRLGLPTLEPGRELYSVAIDVAPATSSVTRRQFLQPRSLILSLQRVFHIDAEKDICILDKSTLDLLGGEPGDYVRIHAYHATGKANRIVRRAMCGRTGKWDHWPVDRQYPEPGAIHLDAADRALLGLDSLSQRDFEDSVRGYPLLVSISVPGLIKKRVLLYTFSFLAAFVGLSLVGLRTLEIYRPTEVQLLAWRTMLGALLGAFVLMLLIIHLEIRSRITP